MLVIPTAFVEDAAGATLVGWLIGKTEYDFCFSLRHDLFECSFFKIYIVCFVQMFIQGFSVTPHERFSKNFLKDFPKISYL